MKKRIEWLDRAKGIGILTVILGHCISYDGFLHNWIFSWHMPLFFIVSGIFIKDEPIIKVLQKKSKVLLLPYLLFSLLGFFITLCVPMWRKSVTLKTIAKDIYLAWPNYINVSSVWFLVCLFVCTMMIQLIIKIENRKIEYAIILILMCAGFMFSLVRHNLSLRRLPFNLDAALIALPFLAMGFYGKHFILCRAESFSNYTYKRKVAVFSIFAPLSVAFTCLNGKVNLHGLTFGNPVLYILAAVIGSVFIGVLCCTIKGGHILKWLGRNTVKILGLQAILIRAYILIVNECFGTEYMLYYLPLHHGVISFIFVTLSCVILCRLFN